ncbi:cobyrinate a,c-diamide synthase [Nocardioides sp. Kera G14]|nr:cobyrinate a,c-diamide synthase [Nocardioides sp. Kera G14]UDY25028.1 cobyrinate a,c-diamide synthase [Nocardioides sp. Kera G14]
MSLPRLVVAAPSTGQGKTTVATGLMAALRIAGHKVSGHKVGPDYIDPGYHALATGRPGRNVDPHLVGEERIVPLLLHGARGADVAVIEGVMGLYDGRLGTDGYSSTAHLAKLTGSPVILVVDVARMSRTAAAIAAGMAAYDDTVNIAGVVLNRTGSPRNDAEIVAAMERTGLPVLGLLPRDEELATPSRHLGLVPAAERDGSVALLHRLGEQVAAHLDLDAILAVARSAPDLDAAPWTPADEVQPVAGGERPVIAVAGGRAFTFRYAETEELLRAAGCEVVTFDPIAATALPEGTQGIYLGGGFPEVYAAELAANRALLHDLRDAVASGVPTVAECAGLLYLAETLDGSPMAGVLPATAAMNERLTLRYPVATAVTDSLLTRAGEQVTGHEFHKTRTTPVTGDAPAWEIDGDATGFATPTLHASYLHVHWAGHPHLAQRFADAARNAPRHRSHLDPSLAEESASLTEPTTAPPTPTPRRPLRHHGDAETGRGLLDFAVNVYEGPRPEWLERALRASLAEAVSYPDASAARSAVAQRHSRRGDEVLPTAGAAEAFTLIARLRPWRNPVVVHPQFTEPHAALEQAGHKVTSVLCRPERGFALDPDDVPEDADLVIVGNPTNPTGVLHPAAVIKKLRRKGRLVVVDEAFMDAVPGESESLVRERLRGLVVLRSLTKHWSIPGIRAGYVVGDNLVVRQLADLQTPWSVSTPALAALIECSKRNATAETRRRAHELQHWGDFLQGGLRGRGIDFVPSSAPYVLARLGDSAHAALREDGIAVRRADTFPGLDSSWVRIAVRPQSTTVQLFAGIDRLPARQPA